MESATATENEFASRATELARDRAQRRASETAKACLLAEEEAAKRRNFEQANALREQRKISHEGTSPTEVWPHGTVVHEQFSNFLTFAAARHFPGSTVLQWVEENDNHLAETDQNSEPKPPLWRRLASPILDRRVSHVSEPEPEPVVTHEIRAYPLAEGKYITGNTIVYICEDGSLRQKDEGANPEPLALEEDGTPVIPRFPADIGTSRVAAGISVKNALMRQIEEHFAD